MSSEHVFIDKFTNGTDSGGILGEGRGALDDITFDGEPFEDGELPNNGELSNDGEPPNGDGNDDGNSLSRDPFEEGVDQAIARAKRDPNRVHHIFENPTHNHYWYVTSLDDEGNWDLIRQAMRDNQGQIENAPNKTPDWIQTRFGAYTVQVRYIIIDGMLLLTDAWVIP
jgi:hypothetical protein